MSPLSLDLLVLSDLHYIHTADDTCTIQARMCQLGPLLIEGAFQQLYAEGVKLDALLLLGDLVNNGHAPGAEVDLFALVQAAEETGLPYLALPGNHDGDVAQFVSLWACPPGLHELGGYGVLAFHDRVAPDDVTTRSARDLALPTQVAQERPDLPLIAIQHNPLHPQIEEEYPYMPTNTEQILHSYAQAGVLLSLSGHYHKGQPAHPLGDTIYYTIPAACEAPFSFAHVRIRGRTVEICQRALSL
jgi:hypothetical protein